VNAFCLGVLRHEQIGAARPRLGNPVFMSGQHRSRRSGGRGVRVAGFDRGIRRATARAVQVGDPFMEKLVCEACLELLATGAVAEFKTWVRRD